MILRTNFANGSSPTGLAVEEYSVQVVVLHAESFGKLLAGRLKLRADDHPAKIKKDCFDAHYLFFDVPFVLVFLAVDFFVSADGVICRVAGFGFDS